MKYRKFVRSVGLSVIVFAVTCLNSTVVQAIDLEQYPQAKQIIDEIVEEHGVNRARVEAIVADAAYQENIIKAITRPAERMPWHRYRPIFVTDSNVDRGVRYWERHAETLQKAEEEFGVDAEIIVAIIGVETRYGKITGKHRIIDSLLTLTLGYPRRSEFFKSEFIEFLKLSQEEKLDPFTAKGSYAGAMGIPQFISSSYRNYAVDFNGNGHKNLLTETADAIGSVANYLKRHGWKLDAPIYDRLETDDVAALANLKTTGLKPKLTFEQVRASGAALVSGLVVEDDEKVGVIELEISEQNFVYNLGFKNFYVITTYNRSYLYASAVAELATRIASQRNASN